MWLRIDLLPPLCYNTAKGGDGMRFDIKLATPDDAKYCADIHAKSWLFAYSDIVPNEIIIEHNARWLMIWNKILANNKESHYVVTLDDVVIGFLTIAVSRDKDLKESFFEIIGLYLAPEYIDAGYGKQTMDWIKNEIKSRGYNKISLWVLEENNRARRFYEKAGFESDGESKPSGLADTQEVRYICKCNN